MKASIPDGYLMVSLYKVSFAESVIGQGALWKEIEKKDAKTAQKRG